MKGRLFFFLLILVAVVGFATPRLFAESKAAVLGSPHDLRVDRTTGDACIACHTPHGANADGNAMLWFRAIRTSYAVYDTAVNPEFAGGGVDLTLGNKVSLLCLSCHDGAVATNVNHRGSTNTDLIAATFAHPMTSLVRTHPVGFTYGNSLTAKPGEYQPTPTNGVKLFVGTVQCASCHMVHQDIYQPFLRVANNNSALCLSCHM